MNFCQRFLEFVQKTVTTATDAHFIFEYDARRKAISARHAAAEEMPRSLLPPWYTEAMSKPVWRFFAAETRHFIPFSQVFNYTNCFFFLYKFNRLPMDLMKESGCGVTRQKCPPQLDTGWKSGWRHWQRFKLMWWIPFTIPCLPFFDSVPSVVLKPSGIGAGRTLKRFPAPEWAAWSCSLLDRYLAFFASFRNGSTAN